MEWRAVTLQGPNPIPGQTESAFSDALIIDQLIFDTFQESSRSDLASVLLSKELQLFLLVKDGRNVDALSYALVHLNGVIKSPEPDSNTFLLELLLANIAPEIARRMSLQWDRQTGIFSFLLPLIEKSSRKLKIVSVSPGVLELQKWHLVEEASVSPDLSIAQYNALFDSSIENSESSTFFKLIHESLERLNLSISDKYEWPKTFPDVRTAWSELLCVQRSHFIQLDGRPLSVWKKLRIWKPSSPMFWKGSNQVSFADRIDNFLVFMFHELLFELQAFGLGSPAQVNFAHRNTLEGTKAASTEVLFPSRRFYFQDD